MKLDDFLKRGWLYQATGYTILISFLFTNAALVFIPIPKENRELFIGNLVNFFYGTSNNNKPIKETNETPN
jgi:hypothetical protein